MKKTLIRLQNPICPTSLDIPHLWKKFQMAPDPDYSELIDNKSTKIIQSVVGTMLYYTQSVHPKMIQEIS